MSKPKIESNDAGLRACRSVMHVRRLALFVVISLMTACYVIDPNKQKAVPLDQLHEPLAQLTWGDDNHTTSQSKLIYNPVAMEKLTADYLALLAPPPDDDFVVITPKSNEDEERSLKINRDGKCFQLEFYFHRPNLPYGMTVCEHSSYGLRDPDGRLFSQVSALAASFEPTGNQKKS